MISFIYSCMRPGLAERSLERRTAEPSGSSSCRRIFAESRRKKIKWEIHTTRFLLHFRLNYLLICTVLYFGFTQILLLLFFVLLEPQSFLKFPLCSITSSIQGPLAFLRRPKYSSDSSFSNTIR